ncbi:hypothetical protein EJB05_26035, partial [Eragrostis curvula]
MSAMQFPIGAVECFNKKRRAFMWSGQEKTTGAQCLIAWDRVCQSKENGGLGIKQLGMQNQCLLLKLIHRLFHPGDSSLAAWAREQVSLTTLEGDVDGDHWTALRSLLPVYQSITTVQIGNGRSTAFWEDNWLDDCALNVSYPALFTHVYRPGASVHDVLEHGLRHFLVPRLSTVASNELAALEALLTNITLTNDEDERVCPLAAPNGQLKSAPLYKLAMQNEGEPCNFFEFVWHNRAPPRIQFFAWLLVHGRIQCKTNLLTKHVVDNDVCDICHSSAETPDHIISQCPFAASFWERIGFSAHNMPQVAELWTVSLPAHILRQHSDTFLLLCCWQLWKHRHDVVFRHMDPSLPRLLRSCRDEAMLWRCRLPIHDRGVVDNWCVMFQM